MMRSSTIDRPRTIFHLAHADHWEAAKRSAERTYDSPITSKSLGFIQAADDAEVLRGIARNSGAQGVNLVLLEIDTFSPSLEGVEVLYLPTSPAGGPAVGDDQPRLMGSLPVPAVIAATPLSSGGSGGGGGRGGGGSKLRVKPPPPMEAPVADSSASVCCGGMFAPRSSSATASSGQQQSSFMGGGGGLPSLYSNAPSLSSLGFPSLTGAGGYRSGSGPGGGGGHGRDTWGAFDEEVVEFVEQQRPTCPSGGSDRRFFSADGRPSDSDSSFLTANDFPANR
jgi:uncharacterized protein (DUF952 family)